MKLVPKYIKKFKCIGPNCEDNCCCHGWNIFVDKQTYKKYKKIPKLKGKLNKYMEKNEKNPSIYTYAKLKMTDEGICPFLDENKLCEIHKNYGEKDLSITCSKYPRNYNYVGGILEESGCLSCPEIARVALLSPNPMEFDEVEYNENSVKNFWRELNGTDKDIFWKLRIFTISLIQNRNISLSERLIILGLFYQKADKYFKLKQKDSIIRLIENYEEFIMNSDINKITENIEGSESLQLQLINIIITNKNKYKKSSNNQYEECIELFYKGLDYKENNEKEIIENYKDAFENYYKPFMKEHEYVLENYLVNNIFNQLFPLGSNRDLFDEYCILILNYILIKSCLIGISRYYKYLNEEIIIKLIYSFYRAYNHGNNLIELIFEELKKTGKMEMKYIAMFIKN